MDVRDEQKKLLGLTTEIVASFTGNTTVVFTDLHELITSVFQALRLTGAVIAASSPEAPEAPVPAVPVNKSVMPEYIVCLEDGQKRRVLKRHLARCHSTTPTAYRERWGLSPEYPMVAPAYAEVRSQIAKSHTFGRRAKPVEAVIELTTVVLPGKPTPPGRFRKTGAASVTRIPAIPRARGRAAAPTTVT